MSFSTIGIVGAVLLVIGAAYPIRECSHPVKSSKNWLFTLGNASMFAYSLMNYLEGGPIFFLFLQILVALSTVMMLLNVPDRIDMVVMFLGGLVLVGWSLFLFEDLSTVYFVLGLVSLSLGFALEMGTARRNLALALGSILIALFSYFAADWIFFWLNSFFAIFSGYYAVKLRR